MKIDVAKFCGLSRRSDFQIFLKSLSEQYYNDLISFLNLKKGCGYNRKFMEGIYSKLKDENKESLVIEFLSNNYPMLLIHDDKMPEIQKTPKTSNVKKDVDSNIHGVFPLYRPGLLLLPQRMIFVDDSETRIYNRTINFIRRKISTDYLILKGDSMWHSYIEFFDQRFASEADGIQKEDRPIAIYRRKHNLK